jgi:molybdate transport system permease protein
MSDRPAVSTSGWSLLDLVTSGTLMAYAGLLMLLLAANIGYLEPSNFIEIFKNADLRAAIWLSLITSTLTAALSLLVAVPIAYALSRLNLPGRLLLDTLVDVPIVLPPLVMGISLLVFFRTPLGRAIEAGGLRFAYTPAGIVLAQFLVVSPYAIRTVKAAMDDIDPRLENVARTLGWSQVQVFLRVTLPMLRGGILAGGVITWSQAIGLFGPMMVFAGTMRGRTEVMATSIYLELSVGRIQMALAISMLMIAMAMVALLAFKRLMGGMRSPW